MTTSLTKAERELRDANMLRACEVMTKYRDLYKHRHHTLRGWRASASKYFGISRRLKDWEYATTQPTRRATNSNPKRKRRVHAPPPSKAKPRTDPSPPMKDPLALDALFALAEMPEERRRAVLAYALKRWGKP